MFLFFEHGQWPMDIRVVLHRSTVQLCKDNAHIVHHDKTRQYLIVHLKLPSEYTCCGLVVAGEEIIRIVNL